MNIKKIVILSFILGLISISWKLEMWNPFNRPVIQRVEFIEPEMVLIPARTFIMGDHFQEGYADELPVHEVYLDAFYIGKYEVTNAEFELFVKDNAYTKVEKY